MFHGVIRSKGNFSLFLTSISQISGMQTSAVLRRGVVSQAQQLEMPTLFGRSAVLVSRRRPVLRRDPWV